MSTETETAPAVERYNAADPKHVRVAGRRLSRAATKRYEQVRKQLGSYDGRAFVWTELERHGIFDVVSGPDAAIFQFLGKREAGIQLLIECQRLPALYLEMQREAIARADRDKRDADAAMTPSATDAEGEDE